MNTSKFDSIIKSTNVRNISFTYSVLNKVFRLGEFVYPKAGRDFVRRKFFTPVTKPLTSVQESWINNAQAYKIKHEDKNLAVWKIGNGPSILFVHGWNGRGVQFHRFFQPALDEGYSVIFFDAPAHGMSEGEITNYLEITKSLEGIFNHKIGKDITGVVAHSLGTSAIINHMSRHQSDIPVVFIAAALRLMKLLIASFQVHGVPRKTYLKLIGEVEEAFQVSLETQNPIDLISKLENNVLIIHDQGDRTTPIAPARIVASQLKNVDLIETEGYGHNQLLKKKMVIDNALGFISSYQMRQQQKELQLK